MVKNARIVTPVITKSDITKWRFVISGYFLSSDLVMTGVHRIFAGQFEYSFGIDENLFCFSFATIITKKMIEIYGIIIIGLMWQK